MAVLRGRASLAASFSRSAMVARWIIILAASLLSEARILAQISREYQVKAVFLFNFAQFVEWPPTAFADETTPLTIGILGTDPFREFLDQVVANETVRDRKLAVERYRRVEDIKGCHILFISKSEEPQLEHIIRSLKGRPILTVSDMEQFVLRGGMIRFITESRKVRFRINVDAARAENLVISSKLLRLSDLVPAPTGP